MSKRLNQSLKKIDSVFDVMYKKGISVSGDRWSERTKNTYKDMMKAFANEYHQTFGVADVRKMTDEDKIDQLIQKRIDNYHNGNLSEAYNVKTLVAAVKNFNLGVQETKVFSLKEKFKIGDPDQIRETLKKNYVIRQSGASQTLRATPDECKSVLDNIKNSGYDVQLRSVAYHAGKIGFETGGRITAILKLKAGDFRIDPSRNEITFNKDKGGLTRSVAISGDTAAYLAEMKKEKKDDEPIFSVKRADGTFMPIKEVRKGVSKIISKAGKHLERKEKIRVYDRNGKRKTIEVTRKFSSHSFRKSFALERTGYYGKLFKDEKRMNSYVAARIHDNPKLKEKLDNIRERLNKNRKTPRDLTNEEYAIFFTSVDLGHFRNDVITAFYTTFKEVEAYYRENV